MGLHHGVARLAVLRLGIHKELRWTKEVHNSEHSQRAASPNHPAPIDVEEPRDEGRNAGRRECQQHTENEILKRGGLRNKECHRKHDRYKDNTEHVSGSTLALLSHGASYSES